MEFIYYAAGDFKLITGSNCPSHEASLRGQLYQANCSLLLGLSVVKFLELIQWNTYQISTILDIS
jgi:hypothetical protein